MSQTAYLPLRIQGYLEADMRQILDTSTGADTAIAAVNFVLLCEGDPAHAKPRLPSYGASARTVWRVENQPNVRCYVNVFDWGEDLLGIPNLRIWFLDQVSGVPVGIGAFKADMPNPTFEFSFPEQGALLERVRSILGSSAYFQDE